MLTLLRALHIKHTKYESHIFYEKGDVMKKISQARWLIVYSLAIASFFHVTTKAVVKEAIGHFIAAHAINSIDKTAGQWFTVEVLGADGITKKVFTLDIKLFINAILKSVLIENDYTLDNKVLPTTTAFDSGIRFLSVQELYGILKRAWLQWEKLHPSEKAPTLATIFESINATIPETISLGNAIPIENLTTNLTTIEEPHTLLTGCKEITNYLYNEADNRAHLILRAPSMSFTIMQSLVSDPQSAIIAAIYFVVSYYMTTFTRNLSGSFLKPFTQLGGFACLNNEPFNAIIKASIGIVLSEYIMLYWTRPYLKQALQALDLYDDEKDTLHLTMYKAGIKTPFAIESAEKAYKTLTNPAFYNAFAPWFTFIFKLFSGAAYL